MKYLVVDDHALVTTALSMLLQTRDPEAEVHTAANAAEALALIDEHGESTDLLILDLSLPDVKGTELMEEIVNRMPMLKILVLSALSISKASCASCSWAPPGSFRSRLTPTCSRPPSTSS